MDKEKEIQEMAHIVGKIKYGFFAGCEDESCGDCYIYRVDIDCGYLKQAEQLYLAGYRKQENAAIEILSKVGKMFVADYEGNEHQIKELPWFRVLCRDYKVEL